jgi:hypothetical protein
MQSKGTFPRQAYAGKYYPPNLAPNLMLNDNKCGIYEIVSQEHFKVFQKEKLIGIFEWKFYRPDWLGGLYQNMLP